LSRERLGGTGIGHGVAIPHGRLKHGDRPRAAMIRLKQGVDFDAIDNEPVDLLFALVVPEQSTEEHLKILAMLAAMFQDAGFRQRLRQAGSAEEIMQIIRDWQSRQ
jgi:PTS system nitrogen regulatory IIA component